MATRKGTGLDVAPQEVVTFRTGLQTFCVNGTALTPVADATDIITISGSASKVIRIAQFRLHVTETTATKRTFSFIIRSTANTGGSPTAKTAFRFDRTGVSGFAPAATATVNVYDSANAVSLGTAYATFNAIATTAVTAGIPVIFQASSETSSASGGTFFEPITLRGANESFCVSYNGATLGTGMVIPKYDIIWTESDA